MIKNVIENLKNMREFKSLNSETREYINKQLSIISDLVKSIEHVLPTYSESYTAYFKLIEIGKTMENIINNTPDKEARGVIDTYLNQIRNIIAHYIDQFNKSNKHEYIG